ncbi:MAG TPA: hypothetical protein EYP29_05180 [Thermoplasmata archaeon]|nr:hypothetical protein [Thermoplasmata archaeon]
MVKKRLMELLQNRFFALFFGTAVGLPFVFLLYLYAGPSIFTSGGGSIEKRDIIIFLPWNLSFILGMNYFAGWLKRAKGWKTNYTRKVTHISNFSFLMMLTWFGGYTATLIFALLMIAHGIGIFIAGDGNIFYEAVAREQDEPYRAFYIVMPTVATIIAVLLNRAFFGPFASVGYLVSGWGDASGEPVGVRFGKHKYRVPTITGISCTRSYEGSAAVFFMSFFAATFSLVFLLDVSPILSIVAALVAAAGSTVVEAISPHGFDNFTLQLTSVALVWAVIHF